MLSQPRLRRLGPQPTVRWRLTLLYSGLFLTCGAALLAISDVLFAQVALEPVQPGLHVRLPAGIVVRPAVSSLALARERAVAASALAHQRSADLHRLLVQSWIALAIMAIVSGVVGWVVAGRVLQPLRRITEAAERISDTNLHERLALPGPRDELRQLADTIDGLLERLEKAFEAQRRFVSNASHELRTPLAIAPASRRYA
ncbi:MAG: HAMP domain-containing protein [Solirubrobacteraceae bacterium]